jgi:hypothetical protein
MLRRDVYHLANGLASSGKQIIERETNDIDEMFFWGQGWDYEYLQLSKGPLRFKIQQISVCSEPWLDLAGPDLLHRLGIRRRNGSDTGD